MQNLLQKYMGIDPNVFDYEALESVKEIRNNCTHEDYLATKEQVNQVHASAVKLLIGCRLINSEPTEIRVLSNERRKSYAVTVADKLRLLFAGSPCIEFCDEIAPEDEDGKFFYVDVCWEIVGVFCLDEKIHIMVNQIKSEYHEEAEEQVLDKLTGVIESRIRTSLPEIENIKISIDLSLEQADWSRSAANANWELTF